MEPLAKRQRLSYTPKGRHRDEDDELDFEPEEVDRQRDPGHQLEESRAFAAYKLKSTFEHIFEKYERDFTGIGDEIDLRTGEIVVDNGHIQRLGQEGEDGYAEEDEGMLLEDAFPESDEENDDQEELGYSRKLLPYGADRVDEDEEDRILQGRQPLPAEPPSSPLHVIATTTLQRGNGMGLSTPGRLATEHRLSSLALSRHAPARSSPLSFGAWGPDQGAVDPIWRTPQMPSPRFGDTLTSKLYGTRYTVPAAENQQSIWSLPPSDMSWPSSPYRPASSPSNRHGKRPLKVTQPEPGKLLLAPGDADDEDEILSGGVTRMEVMESPRMKALPAPPANREAGGLAAAGNKGLAEKGQAQLGRPNHKRKKDKGSSQGIRPTGRPLGKTTVRHAKAGSGTKKPSSDKAGSTGEESATESPAGAAVSEAATAGVKKRRGRPKATTLHEPAQRYRNHSTHSETIFASDDELPKGPSIHRLVIELCRGPEPMGLTDPGDIPPESPPRSELSRSSSLPLVEANEPTPTTDSTTKVIPDSQELSSISSSAIATEPAAEEDPPARVQKASAEKFARNEIDPSYEFSDEESGIPVTKVPAEPKAGAIESSPDSASRSGLTRRASARRSAAAAPLDPSLAQAATVQQLQELSELPAPESSEPTLASVCKDQVNWDAPHDIHTDGPEVFEASEIPDQPEDLADVSSTYDAAALVETSDSAQTPRLASLDFSLDMGADLDVVMPDENASRASEQPDSVLAGDLAPDLFPDTDCRPGLQTPPEDGELRTETEVQDSDGSDGISEIGFPEVSEPVLKTPVGRAAVLSPQPQPLLEDTPSSPPLSQTRRSLKRKSRHPDAVPPPIIENEQTATPRVPTTPPTLEEVVADLGSSKKRPSTSHNPGSKTQKKDNPSTPHTQKDTPHKPSSRRSILSLRPEDADEDEISLVLNSWSASKTDHALPLRTVGFSSVRRNTLAKLAGSSPLRGRSIMSSAGVTASGGLRFRTAREGFGGMSTPTKRRGEVPGSPAGSLIQTPGGRMRRCGVDGFSCDRDFCFTCLRG